jgi:hypothetical protein
MDLVLWSAKWTLYGKVFRPEADTTNAVAVRPRTAATH